MATYGSPVMFNNYHSRFRAFNEPMSPNRSWGPAAGRLAYTSPIASAARWAAESASRSSSKSNFSDDSGASPNFSNPRIFYNSPSPVRSPLSQSVCSSERSRNTSSFSDFNELHVASISRIVQDDSFESVSNRGDSNGHRPQARTTLPSWTLDAQGQIRLTTGEILQYNQLKMFARDKLGCQFLQNSFPPDGTAERAELAKQVLEDEDMFETLCSDVFGNFFIQRLIEVSNVYEQRWVSTRLLNKMNMLCLNRYSCRVVQKAIEILPIDLKGILLVELHKVDIVRLAIDQNANHVIQKIMNSFPLHNWAFIVESMTSRKENLFAVAENKYGCRVVQLAIEILSNCRKSGQAERLLSCIVNYITLHCDRLASNEFANYVIQHIISAGRLSVYRDEIIEDCILRNILSMSQEKYASHVVEKALEYAPPALLKEMMEEIFDGYVPHPETRKDALDIMLFHQYGNYVVQRMLNTCIEAARARQAGIELTDMELRLEWLQRLKERILMSEGKLSKYSSGKKILDMLHNCPTLPSSSSFDALTRDLTAALPRCSPVPPRSYV